MIDMRSTRARHIAVAIALILPSSTRTASVADVRLEAALAVPVDLPEGARRALIQEAESIWRSAGVRIHWIDAAGGDIAPALRVHVIREAGATARHQWVVGELLRFDDGAAIAFASIARAEAVVQAAGAGQASAAPPAVRHHRLGVVLGRAVAHEIGHYLLESGAHTGRGLMRAAFHPREFTDPRAGSFDVDGGSQDRIRARWILPGPLPLAAPTQRARCCR